MTASLNDAVTKIADRTGAVATAVKPIPPRSRPLAVRRQPFGASEAPSRDGRSGRCSRRVLLQIILVIGLGLPELADRLDLGHHFAIPQPRGIHIGDRILGDALLLLVDIIDARPVGEPTIIALAVQRRRIVDLEEEFQDVPVARHCRVEDNLDPLGMRAVITIRGVRNIAARVTHTGRDDAGPLADQILHAPETSSCENSALMHVKPPLLDRDIHRIPRTPSRRAG
nr:hypothetical protein GPGIFMOB_00361 [Acinetobacter gerneri]